MGPDEGGIETMNHDTTLPAPAALAARNTLRNLRTPMLVTAALLQRVIWLVLFSQIFRGLADTEQFRRLGYGSYLEFLVPGMVVLSILFTALQSGMATATDIDSGMTDKLLISPIRRTSVLLGRMAADAITMAAQGVLILVIAVLMGARPAAGVAGVIALLGYATLFGVVWAGVSNLIAIRTRNSELTMVVGQFLTPACAVPQPGLLPEAAAARLAASRHRRESGRLRDRHRAAAHRCRQRLGSGHPDTDRAGRGRTRPAAGRGRRLPRHDPPLTTSRWARHPRSGCESHDASDGFRQRLVSTSPSTTELRELFMTTTIAGKSVLVTGASRGIGQALVEEALRRGATRVYAAARHPVTHPDERVTPLRLDVTDAPVRVDTTLTPPPHPASSQAHWFLEHSLPHPSPPDHADVAVHALGPLEVVVGRTPVRSWGGSRVRTIFEYLLLHGRPVHREVLMELLWRGYPHRSARNNLNVSMYALRRALDVDGGRDYVVHRGGYYALNRDLTWSVDYARFVQAVEKSRLAIADGQPDTALVEAQRAVEEYRGPLFEGDPTADWCATERATLANIFAQTLELLAGLYLDHGDVDAAQRAAQRLLDNDRCRESAHRLLMACHARRNQRDQVVRQYRMCVTELHDELVSCE
jgi:DNA-binding SARP family transcriptional activator